MNPILAVAILAIIILLQFALKRGKSTSRPGVSSEAITYAYARRDYLLSKAERSFFDALRTAVGTSYHVFPQVHLTSLLYVTKGTSNWQSQWNRIQSKCIDFVLCDTERLSPVLAIELDDASHQDERRHERDGFLDDAFESAGLQLLHVRAASGYSLQELRAQIGSIVKL